MNGKRPTLTAQAAALGLISGRLIDIRPAERELIVGRLKEAQRVLTALAGAAVSDRAISDFLRANGVEL